VLRSPGDPGRRLGLPLSSVRVVCKYMGGGFGSKAELSKHTLIAVLLARRTGRPVRSVLTREESFLCAGNRPPHNMTLKVGATKDGALRAIDLEGVGVVGAYRDQATGGFLAAQLYACPNVRIRETEVSSTRASPRHAPRARVRVGLEQRSTPWRRRSGSIRWSCDSGTCPRPSSGPGRSPTRAWASASA
jgi:xanthine dehydrogenase YagR molybdenum-binding subunit